MAFFQILKSKNERDFELKSKVRQADRKIDLHVRKLVLQCQKYLHLARRAFDLRDSAQFAEMALRYHRSLSARNRWQRYQLKLKAMELQRDEVRATEEFLSGIGAITQTILGSVRPEDIQRAVRDIELAEQKAQELEATLAEHMQDRLEPLPEHLAIEDTQSQQLPHEIENRTKAHPDPVAHHDFSQLSASRLSKMSFDEALQHYRSLG